MPLPTATAYLSVEDADLYFAGSFNAAAWEALTPADKEIALAEATKWLEAGICWKGEKCDPEQPFAWPRLIEGSDCCAAVDCSSLPPAMIQATAELALGLQQNQTAIVGGSSSGAIKKAQLGGLSVEYFENETGVTNRYGPSAPLVLQRFPWLGDLLGKCYLDGSFGASRIIGRVRS
jgi:hypothetical protein